MTEELHTYYCKDCFKKQEQIDRLEQENKTLQAYKDINEDFKQAWDELNEKYKQLRSALEEIRKVLTNEYYIDTVKAIHKINEVLNESQP